MSILVFNFATDGNHVFKHNVDLRIFWPSLCLTLKSQISVCAAGTRSVFQSKNVVQSSCSGAETFLNSSTEQSNWNEINTVNTSAPVVVDFNLYIRMMHRVINNHFSLHEDSSDEFKIKDEHCDTTLRLPSALWFGSIWDTPALWR